MAILTCDICDKSNVPGSHGQDSTGCDVSACFICQGDEFDPYCEMEEATVVPFPTPAPHVASAKDRLEAVRKIARDLYDCRDEETNALRDLHTFEALFLSAFKCIQQKHAKMRNDACRTWGEESCAFEALSNLSYRSEADELEAALALYRKAREDFYNDDLDAVAGAMQEAAE